MAPRSPTPSSWKLGVVLVSLAVLSCVDDEPTAPVSPRAPAATAPLFSGGSPSCVSSPPGLVAWWTGDYTARGHGDAHNGALRNGTGFNMGRVGPAFRFDGNPATATNDFVEIPNAPGLNPTGGLTVEAWVYVTGKANQHRDLVTKDGKVSDRQYILAVSDSNRFRPHVGTGGSLVWFDGTTAVALNTWYHVAMTHDGSTLRLYVNGVPDGAVTAPGAILPTSQPVRLGGGAPAGTQPLFFSGLLDEVAIYDRALGAAEIQAIHAAGAQGKCKSAPASPMALAAGDGLGIEVVSTSCGASNNKLAVRSPVDDVIHTNLCHGSVGTTKSYPGPFAAGTPVWLDFHSGFVARPGKMLVSGSYPQWTVAMDDIGDDDYDDVVVRVTATSSPPGSLSGVVRDSHTHAPIPGAQVGILNTTHLTTTNADGAYSFPSVAPGTYAVKAEAPGYHPVTRSDVVITSGQATTADFAIMRSTGKVAGKVTEASTQTALAGATVTLDETGQTATSDPSGAYVIPDVAEGTYTVTARKAGFHPGSRQNVTVTGGQTTQVDIALQRQTGTLAGRVTDARTGGGLQGAVVTVLETGRFGGTDGSGSYSLAGIPTGTYTVEVTRPNYAPASRSGVVIASDATTPLNVSLQPLPHTINVNVTGSPGVAGIGVTARSVQTEEIFVACTDPTGTARLSVPPGAYLVHARNLPICNSLDVTEWPHPNEGASFNTSATETANHVGVLYRTSDGGSVTLNPSNYRGAVQSPLGLSPGGESSLQLRFQTGATIRCTLLDQNGEPFTLAQKEHFYGVLPFGSGSGLPPSLNPKGLPPGIANVLATLQSGSRSDQCQVRGVPAGAFVMETNRVLVNGEVVTYREGVTVTEAEAASGATVEVTGEPEPLRASTGYLFEPIGDSPSSTDVGLLTYGWGVTGDRVSNDFVVAADFAGLGEYVLELITGQGQRIEASAVCEAKRCKLLPSTPKAAQDIVRVSGTGSVRRGVATGTVIWTVSLPGVTSVQFRVTTGQRSRMDAAPDVGYLSAVRPARPNGGNSWAVDY